MIFSKLVNGLITMFWQGFMEIYQKKIAFGTKIDSSKNRQRDLHLGSRRHNVILFLPVFDFSK